MAPLPHPDAPSPDDGLMRRRLRVAAVERGQVRLTAERASACGGCAARAGCAAGALAEMAGAAELVLPLARTGPVAPGDEVTLALPATAFLGAAGLAWLAPPASIAAVAALGGGLGWPDWLVALFGAAALLLSLANLRGAERRGRLLAALAVEPAPCAGTAP